MSHITGFRFSHLRKTVLILVSCFHLVKLPLFAFWWENQPYFSQFFEAFKFPDSNKVTGQLKQWHLRPKKNFTGESMFSMTAEFSKSLWNTQIWDFSHNLFCYIKHACSPMLGCKIAPAQLLIATLLGTFCHLQILITMTLYHFQMLLVTQEV